MAIAAFQYLAYLYIIIHCVGLGSGEDNPGRVHALVTCFPYPQSCMNAWLTLGIAHDCLQLAHSYNELLQ